MCAEEDFIQLSALQYLIFCRRQCALIHIEQVAPCAGAWIETCEAEKKIDRRRCVFI